MSQELDLRTLLLAGVLAAAANLCAQLPPVAGAAQFSNGVHPTIDAVVQDADLRTVETFWRNELKAVSVKVSNKKELTGEAARIPAATMDTLRILIKVEQHKGAAEVTAHIAFLTATGYVGPDSPQRELDGCMAWVQQRSTSLQRIVAQKNLDGGNRELLRQQRRLEDLKRDKRRAENGILKAAQRSERAAQEQAAAEQELEQLANEGPASTDSTGTADKDRQKLINRANDKVKRSATAIAYATKRTKDLQWEIKKNEEDQAAQEKVVDRQQAEVKSLEEKLQAIP